ncbi:hypothetical protein C8R47DRAFT_1076499 [Mycena vitilis]|nr:hypothetical protein C8R47DRAFT_1076499 [Mycena vitilis]
MIFSSFSAVALLSLVSLQSASASKSTLFRRAPPKAKSTIVQLFEWPWDSVASGHAPYTTWLWLNDSEFWLCCAPKGAATYMRPGLGLQTDEGPAAGFGSATVQSTPDPACARRRKTRTTCRGPEEVYGLNTESARPHVARQTKLLCRPYLAHGFVPLTRYRPGNGIDNLAPEDRVGKAHVWLARRGDCLRHVTTHHMRVKPHFSSLSLLDRRSVIPPKPARNCRSVTGSGVRKYMYMYPSTARRCNWELEASGAVAVKRTAYTSLDVGPDQAAMRIPPMILHDPWPTVSRSLRRLTLLTVGCAVASDDLFRGIGPTMLRWANEDFPGVGDEQRLGRRTSVTRHPGGMCERRGSSEQRLDAVVPLDHDQGDEGEVVAAD